MRVSLPAQPLNLDDGIWNDLKRADLRDVREALREVAVRLCL